MELIHYNSTTIYNISTTTDFHIRELTSDEGYISEGNMTNTTALNLDPHCGWQVHCKENCVSQR